MGWIFEGIETEEEERKYSDRELIERSIRRVAPYKSPIIISTVTMIGLTFVGLLGPLIFANLIDTLERTQNYTDLILGTIVISGATYFILSVLNWVGDYLINIQFARLVPDFMVTLRGDIFDAFQKQDMKFFDKHRSGRLNSRVSSDAADYGGAVSIVLTVVGQFLIIISVFLVLFLINPPLALLTASVVPILLLASFLFRRVARNTSMAFRKVHASVNAAMAESVSGIQVSKSFGVEAESLNEFKEINMEHYKAGFKRNISMNMFFPFVSALSAFATVTILLVGGGAAIQNLGFISTGTLYIFLSYLDRFFFPVTQLVNFYAQIQAGFAAYERILQVIDTEPEVQDSGVLEVDEIKGKIEFQNINFEYEENNPVLRNFSLTINPGERLAIVGHTGAGKTSIISILTRFYEFQGGKILVDGINVRDIKMKSYRKHLGIVLQTPFLFSGTIEENITYGRKDASKEDFTRALEISRVDEILEYLKDGLKTEVGEGGSSLSTGQRQLVSFARALLADPKILILDEATSSVDAYTESIIQESLEELMKGRTSIIIAHRLSTVKNADRIIVLEKGKIIEEGTHDALLTKGEVYANLYNTYFKHQEVTWEPESSMPELALGITPPP
ncbi:MAG: ABC transporter ATP-binding protein [Candidatus Heimdallarchaeota archaeon]|nr:ABC transporter ATP-binding protein [Candidatus Heimdallarchaeota archaeon]